MIKVDIVNEASKIADITKVKAEVAVDAVFDAMRTSMQRENGSSFRGFWRVSGQARKRGIGRNPAPARKFAFPGRNLFVSSPARAPEHRINIPIGPSSRYPTRPVCRSSWHLGSLVQSFATDGGSTCSCCWQPSAPRRSSAGCTGAHRSSAILQHRRAADDGPTAGGGLAKRNRADHSAAGRARHYLACRYYDVDASLPFFIPFLIPIPIFQTGTFGASFASGSPSRASGCCST